MMFFKFIRIYRFEAENKKQALAKILDAIHNGQEDEYFQVEFLKPDEPATWGKIFKNQITGK